MLNCPPHSYGPASLLGYAVRLHIADYMNEAKRSRKEGRPLARRACLQMALLIRADFRNARVCSADCLCSACVGHIG